MRKLSLLFLLLFFSTAAHSQQLSKVYVLSEGGFNAGSSKLSMFDTQTNNFSQNIFTPGNIGLYPDGLVYYQDYLYLLEQGNYGSSGKIYKLDTLGNVINSAAVGTNPYSLAISNGKVYVTNGSASNVSILSLNDFTFVKNVTVGVYPQEIISINNKVFVANNSLYGGNSDSTISVIDTDKDSVVKTITVKKDPASLCISRDGNLFVGCPGDEENGRIFKIDPVSLEIVGSFKVPGQGFGNELSIDHNNDIIYFISYNNDIVKCNLSNGENSVIVPSVYPNNYYYGYNFDYTRKNHYVLDAKSFTINGSLIILDSTGTIINNFETGVAPRRVVLKYNNGQPSDISENNYVINSFELKQNYPNPFNPSTTIRWQTPINGHQKLIIYDMLGNELTKLVDEYRSAGNYSIIFNANNLASGIYIYKLNITDGNRNIILTKKMMLMK